MRKTVGLVVVALLPVLLAGLASLAGHPPPQAQAAEVAPPELAMRIAQLPAIVALPAPSRAPSDAMRRQFEGATNYAAFIHDAMQRPAEGGRFYAYLANARCTDFASWRRSASSAITGDPALHDKAVRRIEELQRRCSGVNSDFVSQLGFARAFRYVSDKSPDALMLTQGPGNATDAASIDADLARARQAGDPYLLATLIEANAAQLAARIDGANADPARQEVLYLAAAAAACQIVGDCTDSLPLQMQCFAGGECEYGDRRQALRAQVPAQSQALFDRTVQALLALAQ